MQRPSEDTTGVQRLMNELHEFLDDENLPNKALVWLNEYGGNPMPSILDREEDLSHDLFLMTATQRTKRLCKFTNSEQVQILLRSRILAFAAAENRGAINKAKNQFKRDTESKLIREYTKDFLPFLDEILPRQRRRN